MNHDQKRIEIAHAIIRARKVREGSGGIYSAARMQELLADPSQNPSAVSYIEAVLADLDAINASGVAWVAPWEPKQSMIDAACAVQPDTDVRTPEIFKAEYRAARYVCLAERRGDGR